MKRLSESFIFLSGDFFFFFFFLFFFFFFFFLLFIACRKFIDPSVGLGGFARVQDLCFIKCLRVMDDNGWTPFGYACLHGRISCVREMLKDSRVKVNEPRNGGWTPVWRAAFSGYLDIIKWWIASGREMDLGEPGDVDKTDAIGVAKEYGETEVVTLLEIQE